MGEALKTNIPLFTAIIGVTTTVLGLVVGVGIAWGVMGTRIDVLDQRQSRTTVAVEQLQTQVSEMRAMLARLEVSVAFLSAREQR